MGKREAASSETRSRILEAARQLLATESNTDLSMEAIARKADVSRLTIYYQFSSRAGLRMFPLLQEHRVRSLLTNGGRAMFVYDFVCAEPIGVCRTAELVTLRDGLIASVEIFFDPQPFEKLMQSQARGSARARIVHL